MTNRKRERVQLVAAGFAPLTGFGRKKLSRNLSRAALLGAVCLPVCGGSSANADVTQDVINSIIQTVIQNIRDDVYRITHQAPPPAAPLRMPLRFSGEDSASQSIYDEAFGALAYNGMPTKAPLMKAPPPPPPLLWGIFGSGAYNWDFAPGVRTRTGVVAGGFNVTKIGVFTDIDAVTFIFTGNGSIQRSSGVEVKTPGASFTISYQRGDFSTDSTLSGSWPETDTTVGPDIFTTRATTASWASNYQYRFNLQNNAFIEPTVGYTYTEASAPGVTDTRTWEVRGGGRIGTEFALASGTKVQPSLTAVAFSPVRIEGPFGPNATEGKVGERVTGKLNFILSDKVSASIQGDGRWFVNTHGYGATAMLSVRLN